MNDIDYDALAGQLPPRPHRHILQNLDLFHSVMRLLIAAAKAGDTSSRLPGEIAEVLHGPIGYSGSMRSLSVRIGVLLRRASKGWHVVSGVNWKVEQELRGKRHVYRVKK